MIKLIQSENELDRSLLLKSLSGRKMLAYMVDLRYSEYQIL